jgi:hypothetical protein
MKKQLLSTLIAGLLLMILAACGSQTLGGLLVDAGTALLDAGTAQAQSMPCGKWQVQRIVYNNIPTLENTDATTSTFAGAAFAIPAGWEPFGGTAYGGSFTGVASQYLLVRRCAP